MPQASPSNTATRSLPHYFAHIVTVKFAPTLLPTILTEHVCHHNSFWESRCDSNHAPTISKTSTLSRRFRHTFSAYVLSRRTSSLTSDHPRYFELFRPYFLLNLHISANTYQNKPFQANSTKYSKNKPNRPDVFNDANCDTQGIKFQR